VLNVLKVNPGNSIAIIGVGAVGLAAIMAAKIAQADTIIPVDIQESRLELAKSLGATHTIVSKDKDINEEIRKILGDGVDYAID
jgi:aryl-alcohol dehydrogenase